MDVAASLAFALPLLGAALCALTSRIVPRRVLDVMAIGIACASAVASWVLLRAARDHTVVVWFGGWHPRHGIDLGIAFTIDPIAAGLAALAATLAAAALLFAWHYYEEPGASFHVLMLVFLGALVGFSFSGDLFTLFVFFELMSAAGFALCAFKAEDADAVHGAFSFAVTNSAGAFFTLAGIALVYGRTGALNMTQAGHALAASAHGADALVALAFTLIAVGFFVKGAIVPFHFWLDDAHAVAPTPLCVLFSGIMVQLGLYAVARVFWTTFSGVFGVHVHAVGAVFLTFGVATAVVGALLCACQRHLKRLLAFSTIAHGGTLLIALGLMTPGALAGFWVYVAGHGLVKGALFLCAGILLARYGSVDVNTLRGKLREEPLLAALIFAGALALAGLPPFATALGRAIGETPASAPGAPWVAYLSIAVSAITGGAVLRALGTMAFGWGPDLTGATPSKESPDTRRFDRVPVVMYVPVVLLLAVALGLGLRAQPVQARASQAAVRFMDRAAMLQTVSEERPHVMPAVVRSEPFEARSLWTGIVSAFGALLFAALALRGVALTRALAVPLAAVRRLHTGVVSDYAAWLACGAALLGGAMLLVR
jgi:multicomponent Na+:H+ antiporter subunit D